MTSDSERGRASKPARPVEAGEPSQLPLAPQIHTAKYDREIQLLINVIEPDPEYQPRFVSDEASLLDCLGTDEDVMVKRLTGYFGSPFTHNLRQPVWRLVEELKRTHPRWLD